MIKSIKTIGSLQFINFIVLSSLAGIKVCKKKIEVVYMHNI